MRLYTPRILSFFLALCPFLAAEAAQPLYSVSGRVTDAATGEPVTGAVVMVKDTYKGTETDMEGRWRLDNLAAGDYTFAVSFISYKSIEVSCRVAADVEGVDVRLESDSEEVEEVVVKARMRSDTEIAMLGTIRPFRRSRVVFRRPRYRKAPTGTLRKSSVASPASPS